MAQERLQKILAAAGVASRRKSEELITQGRVEVNGQIVSELGAKADAEADHIKVDGKPLRGPERKRVLMLNKPKGYVSTTSDPENRATVMDLIKDTKEAKTARLYPVGRLDYHSEGLLLLTNDGDLAEQLTRASSHVQKTYLVKIAGKPDEGALERLRRGVKLAPRPIFDMAGKPIPGKAEPAVTTAPARIEVFKDAENPWYEVTLIEGRNRQIRRMFEEVGHHVEKIKRVRYGPLELNVMPGEFRELTKEEVERLRRAPRQRPASSRQPPAERRQAARPEFRGDKTRDARSNRGESATRDFRERAKRERKPFEPRGPQERRPLSRDRREGAPQERGGRERFGSRQERPPQQRFGGRDRDERAGRQERFGRGESGHQGPGEQRFDPRGPAPFARQPREQHARTERPFNPRGPRQERGPMSGAGREGGPQQRGGLSRAGGQSFGKREFRGRDERAGGGAKPFNPRGPRQERRPMQGSPPESGAPERGARGERFGPRDRKSFGGQAREPQGRGDQRSGSRGRNERDERRGQRNDNRGPNRGTTKRPKRG